MKYEKEDCGTVEGELNGKSVLLVEGERWTREPLSLFLRAEGCRPHVAASASEAMEVLSGSRFDLIICEYWLPDMDGLSFLKLFGDSHPGTVKILTSSYMSDQAMGEAKGAGIHHVVRPPFTVDMLERAFYRRASLAVNAELVADRKSGEKERTRRRRTYDEQDPRPIGGYQTGSQLGGTGAEEERYCSRVLESALRTV